MAPRPVGGASSPSELILAGTAGSLSDAALVAFVLGAGDDSVGREILGGVQSTEDVWRVTPEELVGLPGVGPVSAARFLACLEVSRRAGVWRAECRPTITSPEDVVTVCWPQLRGSDREHFWALALTTKNRLIRTVEVSVGSLNASIVHPRELFKEAVRVSAASVVVVHNHPSGDPTPSGADIQLTRRLVKAGDVLGIEVLDHVVIGDGGESASMRELGLM